MVTHFHKRSIIKHKTIFITHAGIVKACGLNGKFGALGLETSLENVYTPTPVLSLGSNNRRITDAGLGANFSAYLNEDGHVYVCGQINMEKHFEKDDDDDDVKEEMDDKKEDRIPLEPFTVPTYSKYISATPPANKFKIAGIDTCPQAKNCQIELWQIHRLNTRRFQSFYYHRNIYRNR